jgi:hypothetical protein
VFAAIALTALTLAVIVALAQFGATVIDRTAARAAADAAALASVTGGRVAAVEIARANGGEVVTWSAGPGPHDVTVTVRVGDALAVARATDAP